MTPSQRCKAYAMGKRPIFLADQQLGKAELGRRSPLRSLVPRCKGCVLYVVGQ
jgi:hypothetical protein